MRRRRPVAGARLSRERVAHLLIHGHELRGRAGAGVQHGRPRQAQALQLPRKRRQARRKLRARAPARLGAALRDASGNRGQARVVQHNSLMLSEHTGSKNTDCVREEFRPGGGTKQPPHALRQAARAAGRGRAPGRRSCGPGSQCSWCAARRSGSPAPAPAAQASMLGRRLHAMHHCTIEQHVSHATQRNAADRGRISPHIALRTLN